MRVDKRWGIERTLSERLATEIRQTHNLKVTGSFPRSHVLREARRIESGIDYAGCLLNPVGSDHYAQALCSFHKRGFAAFQNFTDLLSDFRVL